MRPDDEDPAATEAASPPIVEGVAGGIERVGGRRDSDAPLRG